MARNSEKAMTALARWRQAKLAEEGLDTKNQRRPYLASECHDLKDAEKWRIQVIREASKKMTQIQNAGLGEFKIRDLNDEINKLLREKRHWENRIVELGGRDMRRRSRMLDKSGKEVPGVYGMCFVLSFCGVVRHFCVNRELFREINLVIKTKEVGFTEIFQKTMKQKFCKLHIVRAVENVLITQFEFANIFFQVINILEQHVIFQE